MELYDDQVLLMIERLLEEFFSPSTSNVRKHEIEKQLAEIKTVANFKSLCLYLLTNSSSQYVTMYALSSLETVIGQQWPNTDWAYKEQVKTILYGYLIERGLTAPHFIRTKYAKLLVDVAKHDWPAHYPNFFLSILELLKNENDQLIGLILLRTTSEEFMSPMTNFNNDRKDEITRLMHQYIPIVFELMTFILKSLDAKPRHSETATPPPSPTHPSAPPDLSHSLSVAAFRPDNKAINKEALATIQHLFTWSPIGQIPVDLITAIFSFTNVSSYAQDDDDIGILAMSTINELLYRKCSPPGTQGFFYHLYHHTVQLLRDITNPSSGRIETLGPDFTEKLSELTTLLIEQHLWRLESDPNFSAIEFLSMLYQLTMQLPSAQCYLHCLGVWMAFVKQIKPQNAQKYSEVFHGLVSAILKKIQFIYNHAQLKETNDLDIEENNETERQIFLKNSIELLALVAEYTPLETFNQILVPWKVCQDVHLSVQAAKDPSFAAAVKQFDDCVRLSYYLKDFSTLTRTLTRLSPLFTEQDNENITKASSALLANLILSLLENATLATNNRAYELKYFDDCIRQSLIDVHAELLASLNTWLVYLSQNTDVASTHLKQLLEITIPTLHLSATTHIPSKIILAAAHLFHSVTDLVFPQSLVVLPPVAQFLHLAPSMKFEDQHAGLLVSSAVINLLFRNWGEVPQESVERRNFLIGVYFDCLTKEFRELGVNGEEIRVREVVCRTLPILTHVVEYCKKFSNASKRLLWLAMKPTIEHALQLFPSFIKYPDVADQILALFLNVLSILQQHVGEEGTKHAIQVFLQVAIREQQSSNLSGLDKLLQILQFVVEAPGSTYRNFLPGILQLCLDSVYPLMSAQLHQFPEVFMALLTLLYSILLHRWQYFYISQVRLGYSPGCSDTEGSPETPQHPEQLLSVLRIFGEALLQPDINIFRMSLAALEELNSKWKLYHKALFRDHLLSQFLTVLLQTLINKSHALLTEDIQIAVYNMASVNFKAFFSTFLDQFARSIEGVAQEHWGNIVRSFSQVQDRDMPTFVQHLQRFVTDARYYHMCNSSKATNLVS